MPSVTIKSETASFLLRGARAIYLRVRVANIGAEVYKKRQSSCTPLPPYFSRKIMQVRNSIQRVSRSCDVFISHRGIDTRRNIVGLLYDHLSRVGLKPFMDTRNMKPGDELYHEINTAIRNCKIGVPVFSPRYCESYDCLHELALLMESKKRVVPIFWNVNPFELQVKYKGNRCSANELQKFGRALEKAKHTVGLTFDSSEGDWSEFLANASHAIKNLLEVQREQ